MSNAAQGRVRVDLDRVTGTEVRTWDDIHAVLDALKQRDGATDLPPPLEAAAQGVAFLTFEFGIDGVTMEIAKYAACLERLFEPQGVRVPIHCIGGNFTDSARLVLVGRWATHDLPGANGWAKWDGGRHFDALFLEDMPAGSERSSELAVEIWRQATDLARHLAATLVENEIGLLIPVNVNSNPGNPALALATVIVAEVLELPVLNSSHDFYWESGKPASERAPGEAAGARDHFFRNVANEPFFRLIERIFPWDGRRWLQLVINGVQVETLVERYGFPAASVRELGTFIEDPFFVPCSRARRDELRRRLSLILGDGEPIVRVTALDRFEERLDAWMHDQKPVTLGVEEGLGFRLRNDSLWFLQPTRVVDRKRIERDWDLIGALLDYVPFRTLLNERHDLTLTLHVTGPVQIEHGAAFRAILASYRAVLERLPARTARRIHLGFSVGRLGHSAFQRRELRNLTVADLYHIADLVLLPSSTEGRGLPILESAAAGCALVCSEYSPRAVYAKVIGEDLDPSLRIRCDRFPEGAFETILLQQITDAVFLPEGLADRVRHNRLAVASRYGMRDLTQEFERALTHLHDSTHTGRA